MLSAFRVYSTLLYEGNHMLHAIVAMLMSFGAVAAPVPKHLMPKEVPYYPTEVGTKWVYIQNDMERPEEITKSEAQGGALRLTVQVGAKGELTVTSDVSKDEVIERTSGNFKIDRTVLRFPLKEGDSWDFVCPIQKGLHAESGKITVCETEDVTVPAGKFRATKVVFTVTEVNGEARPIPHAYTFWYAQGIGLVRLEYRGGEKVLKSFTPGKK
jgi:hypothetical protein